MCTQQFVVDQEWVELIREAMELGLTVEEVRAFLMVGKM
ncbi:anti-repressor SinI family protein [Ammoniphilus sp. CFH 90114]|nr:anti-repressor SinI family protein [Ammoniphilus sp. CFH 90114]RXT04370.1 DNA-binding anti-repressor SinI [Ammoniphilus sp. CFH 90114]